MSEITLPKNFTDCLKMAVAFRLPMFYVGTFKERLNVSSILEKHLKEILPRLTENELEEVKEIYSHCDEDYEEDIPPVITSPYNSIEQMCGGGDKLIPGIVSKSHNGILSIFNASDYRTSVIQLLRVPLKNRNITLSRGTETKIFKSDFTLIVGMSPCPCGNLGQKETVCMCSSMNVRRHWEKLSLPFLNAITLNCNLYEESEVTETSTEELKEEIIRLRKKQIKAYGKEIRDMDYEDVKKFIIDKLIEQIVIKNVNKANADLKNVYRTILALALLRECEINEKLIDESFSFILETSRYIH